MNVRRFVPAAGLALVGGVASAQESGTTIPGLADAISGAQSTATAIAGQVVPAAWPILAAFAGLLGIYLIWRVLKRGARG